MTRYVYPRLPLAVAEQRRLEVIEAFEQGGLAALDGLSASAHPTAAPVPTGGHVADADKISAVQTRARKSVDKWLASGRVPSNEVYAFDAAIGRALHTELAIVSADAAHVGTWSFLSLVVLPDITVLRFPDLHRDRMIGTPRNALRRAWSRYDVLGDLMDDRVRPLGEDELVGLFERTAVARNRRLVWAQAEAVLAYEGPARSAWARQLYKRVRFLTGARLLDILTDDELEAIVRQAASPASTVPIGEDAAPQVPTGPPDQNTLPGPPSGRDKVSQPSELERRFNEELTRLFERTAAEFGSTAANFIWMVANFGAVDAARQIVMTSHPSEAFSYLSDHHRLDLSVEALVLRLQYRQLFDQEVLNNAKARLRDFGYTDVDR